ncbi:PREDICTED: titin-like isoform X2 [Lupinus angustifolius]|uniref:titin-like isoform X2 n=1 Tax=Lupinus angustifolius TaxID=3871 RepID=UPI00092F0D55|nr:PREDICTED: titin-like isoform X2 [Lupinus angustifolius]
MASETVASDHASATDEQIVNKEKSEAIADLITSLADEDEVKHDKPEDPNGGHTAPSSKTEDETNGKPGVVEVQKSDDSPALEASAEDNLKHDKIEDAQTPAATLSKTEEDPKPEPAVVVENTDDPVSLDAHIEDNLKEEKEVIPDSHTTDDAGKSQPKEPPSTETTVEETAQQLQKEPVEIEEEKQPEKVGIPEASDETIEKSNNIAEDIPQTESEAKVVKEAEILETSGQKEEKPKPIVVATEVQEQTQEPENEPEEKPQEAEQRTTVTIPELSTEAITIEEKTREFSAEILKEANESEAVHAETVKAEPLVTEVEDNPKEPENQVLEKKEEEQLNTVEIAKVPSTESSEAVEEKTSEPEVLKETNNHEEEPAEAEKAVAEFTKFDENLTEPEKESLVIPETETVGDTVEVHHPEEADIEVVKETDTSEAEAVPEEAEKPGDEIVVHQPIESEVVSAIEEKPEPVFTEVEEKPRELVEVADDVGETSKEIETKHEILLDTKIEETSKDTIKDPIPLKEDKTDKEEETSITANTEQVSVNEEAQADPENLVEPSLEVAKKIAEVDGKKESGFTDVTEGVSKDEASILEVPKPDSVDHEAETGLKEEREYSVPTSVEENVVGENDYKKEPEIPEAAQESSTKDTKQIEAKTPTTEDDELAVENVKEGHTEAKVDEISSGVSEPVRETLASKFEQETTKTEVENLEKEQTEEPVKTDAQVPEETTKGNDAAKTSSKDFPEEIPAKPVQKQSHNIISKVKQSLVKAGKAIIGKSPSSKNHSTEAKDDIPVK